MGLSFHYRGRLKSPELLQPLIEELTDIAKANDWRYFVFDTEFKNGKFTDKPQKVDIYGIAITPPGTDMVSFSFASNGKMCNVLTMQSNNDLDDLEADEFIYYLSVKTQYTSVEIHKKLILLFDYINNKYLEDFILDDEGQFWETRDEKLLEANFDGNLSWIESFRSVLENVPINKNESTEN